MNYASRFKGLLWLLVASLLLSLAVDLALRLPGYLEAYAADPRYARWMLAYRGLDVLVIALMAVAVPGIMRLLDFRRSAWLALPLFTLWGQGIGQLALVGNLLLALWILVLVAHLCWTRGRELYRSRQA
ncbi:hypothetical protein SAMN03159355_05260 [Pseudomonas sp. NFPP10]|uniref:hypothetical protein n=1 Tax=Pseudomonas TaxID=286 RepID=UPI00087ED3BF|nr:MULTISPECIES: hypothetical protein [Pseudomonas]POA84231.1 hypothetical protein C1883_24505 [Pseudomonas protegens]SDA14455.1 hypothetical protein SAMN03159465_01240 [Pseudomonas sp. NFPP12]SEM53951.1 hypothetical protein SAMN03159355_05260 [Pseudomonas sp. NFPP10]SES02671.1 hypothetical protein SAMN03159354_05085 [Pseudomonas sp. NFPP19]SFI13964.1 hypothetical protein SAMN03159416_01190 [Pseudomonas sp. NFPP08]